MKFNINNYVKVRLTEEGLKHYNNYYSEFVLKFPDSFKVKKDYELREQLWEIMHIFGSETFIGRQNVFVDNIIEIEDVKENKYDKIDWMHHSKVEGDR